MDRKLINRRYKIERQIGEGAAAEVYLAHDSVLNRKVALKSLRPQFAADPGFRARFEREAQAAARFNHPNIIAIFDVGEDRGLPYIVMEFVDGDTLREIIDQEAPIHADDVAILVEQVAAALDYAHQRGLVHRDIKPQNILVDNQGLAKVVDFGIAKGLSDEALTDAAESIGTVQYISPEQASGLMATPESDIYSLAVVAFEMLTGELPFDSETAIGIAMRHVNDPAPDPADINSRIPHEVADIILRALSKDPTHRFPTAGEFARVLTAWRSYTPEDWKAARVRASTGSFPRQAAAPSPAQVPVVTPPPIRSRLAPAATEHAEQTAPLPARSPGLEPEPDESERFTSSVPAFTPASAHRRSPGIGSWLASAIVLAAIGLLLWFGLGLGDRFRGSNSAANPTPASQTINAGSVATKSSKPASTLTAQPAAISVPNVVGMTESQARAKLSEAKLNATLGDSLQSDTVAKGAVVKQSPTTGKTAKSGDAVTLALSSGPAPVDLASLNLIGMNADDAANLLASKEFSVNRSEEGSQTIAAGAVTGVDPPASAQPGDAITLSVSVGDKVRIPVELQGQNIEQVKSALEKLGFTIAGTNALAAEAITDGNGQQLDLAALGIEDGDVVGVQGGPDVTFGGWVQRGAAITVNYYSAQSSQPTMAPAG